ncbi:PhnD/SsuA/transferrin family substrate-binding protein, partial [bacterium]|nr:PhnD/SsuA/transferrin family substrate-binding protein [bacterium]
MRKLFKLAAAVLALGCAIGVASCGGKDEKLIKIQFIPSQDASIINTQAPKLEKLLEERMPGYKFEIKVGTDYTAVVNAMLAGQCDVGFLSAQQYAQVSVENPGKVEPILTSVRSAYQVQIDYQGDVENQIKAMNGEITDYEYLGQQAEQSVTYYNSICITMRDSGINSVTDLAGKKVATQKTSSGAGYVYPAVLLNKNNLKFVTTTPDASKGEVQAVTQNGYPAAVSAVLSGDVDAAWLFIDVRYTAFYNNKDSEYYQ